jgi:hypothetical protein
MQAKKEDRINKLITKNKNSAKLLGTGKKRDLKLL